MLAAANKADTLRTAMVRLDGKQALSCQTFEGKQNIKCDNHFTSSVNVEGLLFSIEYVYLC